MAKWVAVAVVGLLLTGCGVSSTAAAKPEGEKKVALKRATGSAASAKPAPKAQGVMVAPTASPAAARPAAAIATSPVAPTAATAQAKGLAASAVDGPKAGGVAAAAATPMLAVVKAPETVRVFPVRFSEEGGLANMKFDPEDGQARWKVKATGAPLPLGRVSLEVQGDQDGAAPITGEVTAERLGWPAQLTGEAELAVPLSIHAVASLLEDAKVKACTIKVTPLDAAGAPYQDPNGHPVALKLTMHVL